MTELPRYCPERPLPSYSYVPGLSPHPMSDPRGHSFGGHEPPAQPLDDATFRRNSTYVYAIDLFNHGFYWEAHEAWEALWHAAGRKGATADYLKGLIKLAAAGVKVREGRAAGVRQHTERAAELFRSVARDSGSGGSLYGLQLNALVAAAANIADNAGGLAGDGTASAERQLSLTLKLE